MLPALCHADDAEPMFDRVAVSPELFDELTPLLESHWAEISAEPGIHLAPSYDTYRQKCEAGVLQLFTTRLSGALIGYATFFVQPHPHYTSSLQAACDAFYVLPRHREGLLGYHFLTWCDNQLRAGGVQRVMHAVPAARDWSALLLRQGYRVHETIYSRRFD